MVMRTTLLGDNGKGLLLPTRKAAREIRRGGGVQRSANGKKFLHILFKERALNYKRRKNKDSQKTLWYQFFLNEERSGRLTTSC